jgi:hypothetical protein
VSDRLAVERDAGFGAMLKRIEGNGVRTVVVETASRFARDLMVQEVGYAMLKERGIEHATAAVPQFMRPSARARGVGPTMDDDPRIPSMLVWTLTAFLLSMLGGALRAVVHL